MSQFNPTSRMPRPRFSTSLPSGPSVGLQAAGIEDPIVGRDPAGEQLQGALNEFAQTVGIAASIATRNENDKERAQAQVERDQYRAEKEAARIREIQRGGILRGMSSTAREEMPSIIEAIKKGTLAPTADDQNDPELFLERLATERTIDVPEEFRDEAKDHYRSLIANRTLNALYAKQDSDRANAQRVAFGGVTDELLILDDPTKITETMNRAFATIPGIRAEQLDGLAASAMFDFAKRGDRKMVEGFKSMLGKREIDQQDKADYMLATAEGKIRTENEANFKSYSAAARMSGFVSQTPPTIIAEGILKRAQQQGINPDIVENEVKTLFADIEKQQDKQQRELRYQQVVNTKAAIASSTASRAMSGGMKVEIAPVEIGRDESDKPIVYSVAEHERDAVASLRSMHGWNGELGPTAGGWDGLTGDARASYIEGMGRIKQIDPTLLTGVSSMQLNNENISTATKADILSVQTLMQLQDVDQTYARKTVEAASSDEADVAELATILAQSKPNDIPGAIMEAKRIYGVAGTGGLKKLGLEESNIISKKDNALSHSPQMLKAASVRARMYMYGKETPEKAYAKGIADVRATAMEVNGRLVPMGTLYTISPAVKASTEKATDQILTGRVKAMIAADERLRDYKDDFTIERLDDERYFIKSKNMNGFAMPRGVDPVIRASEIESVAAQIYKRDNASEVKDLPSVAALEAELKANELAGPSGIDPNQQRAQGGGTYRIPSLSETTTRKVGRSNDKIKQEIAVQKLMDNYRKSQQQP